MTTMDRRSTGTLPLRFQVRGADPWCVARVLALVLALTPPHAGAQTAPTEAATATEVATPTPAPTPTAEVATPTPTAEVATPTPTAEVATPTPAAEVATPTPATEVATPTDVTPPADPSTPPSVVAAPAEAAPTDPVAPANPLVVTQTAPEAVGEAEAPDPEPAEPLGAAESEAESAADAVVAAPEPVLPQAPADPRALALFTALTARFGDTVAPILAYEARAYAPIWVGPDGAATPAATALVAALRGAPTHALPARRYDADALAASLAGPGAGAEVEAAATVAYLRYARDVRSGVLEPRKVDREIIVHPERPDQARLLADIATAADPAALLAGLAPQHPHYAALQAELAAMVAQGPVWGRPIPGGATLKPDMRGARVEALRTRLVALGDHAADDPSGSAPAAVLAANTPSDQPTNDAAADPVPADAWVYDQALAQSVQRFQARHGLNPDGAVGPATLAALNIEPGFRATQIAVNLERLRWLNRDLGHRRVMVNLADFTMALVEGDRAIFTSRVVVGKPPRNRTPEFSDEMEYMVVNPSWSVPSSIAREEILPALKADPGYLRRKNMVLVGADADSIDWSQVTPRTFPGRVRQGPGAGNALGKVKFMFPNDYAIYLHDTPSKSLFARDTRAFSHGCVRVEKPFDFAHALLAGQEEDPVAAFDRWLAARSERQVTLDAPVPVHLTYATAWIDEAGQRQFRADIYGRDAKVMAALAEAGVALAP